VVEIFDNGKNQLVNFGGAQNVEKKKSEKHFRRLFYTPTIFLGAWRPSNIKYH